MRIALATLLLATACNSAHREWTCAAHCIDEYSCSSDGNNNWKASLMTSKGDTAAAAFEGLSNQCKAAADDLVIHFQCTGGQHSAEGASVASSCAAN